MAEAMIYDALRTPRGKGKTDGSLHEVKPVNLLAGLLREMHARHDFDTAEIEDVVMGCVTPIGGRGARQLFAACRHLLTGLRGLVHGRRHLLSDPGDVVGVAS